MFTKLWNRSLTRVPRHFVCTLVCHSDYLENHVNGSTVKDSRNTPSYMTSLKKRRLLELGSICRHNSIEVFISLCIFDSSNFKRWKLKAKLGLNVCYPNSCQIDCDVMQFFHQWLFFCLALSLWTSLTLREKNI